jgi:hypothetical protein
MRLGETPNFMEPEISLSYLQVPGSQRHCAAFNDMLFSYDV